MLTSCACGTPPLAANRARSFCLYFSLNSCSSLLVKLSASPDSIPRGNTGPTAGAVNDDIDLLDGTNTCPGRCTLLFCT